MNILHSIGAGIAAIGLFIGGLFGYTPGPVYTPSEPIEEDALGRAVNPVATNNYVIAGSGISSSATTLTLTSFTAPVSGVPYTMANFGEGVSAKGYLTIEPGSRTRQEIVSFTGLTQNSDGSATLTGVTRGLLPFSPFTASTTYATAHNGGAQVTVSNPPQLYDALYNYVDNATTSGAVDGTTLAKGIYETASGLEAANTTQTGAGNTSATLVLTSLISTSTGGTAYTIPVTDSTGKIKGTFCCSGTTTLTDAIVGFGSTPSTTVYTTVGTTTYSIPSNLRWLEVELAGGGGGGGAYDTDGTNCCEDSGGAGGYSKAKYTKAQLATSSVIIVVGAGGIGGDSATTPSDATNGAPSRFIIDSSRQINAGGGLSGDANPNPASGGVATGGQINIKGGSGSGENQNGNVVGTTWGGSNPLGFGAVRFGSSDNEYSTSTGYGFGGAGGWDNTTADGTAGGSGIVIITEYF